MNHDFINATIGGLLIGFASIALLLFLGRIAGISGIVWQAMSQIRFPTDTQNSWRWLFLAGLVAGPILVHQLTAIEQPAPSDAGPLMAAIAGILVGFGSKLGSGCTSGHGICGIGRLSRRSIAATLTFISFGIITVPISRHIF